MSYLVLMLGAERISASTLLQPVAEQGVANLSISAETVSRYSSIAADCAGNVHVVWVEMDGGINTSALQSINYAVWDGNAWSTPNSIHVAQYALLPSLAADPSGRLHLVYMSGSWQYYTTTAGGPPSSALSWSQPVPVGQKSSDEYLHWHELISDPAGNLHLLYVNWRGESQMAYSQVWYTSLRFNEKQWSEPVRLSDPNAWAGIIGTSNIVSDSKGALYAIWQEAVAPYRAGDLSWVVFSQSTDGGRTWSQAQDLSNPDVIFNEPIGLAAPFPGQVHALWYSGLQDVVHRVSADGGSTWGGMNNVYSAPGAITRYGGGHLATDSAGHIHVVLPLDRTDIFYTQWNGQTWLAPTNLSSDPDNPTSYWPRTVVALGNELHVVWNKGYAEIALPDLEQRLAAGQYEILHRTVALDAPRQTACELRRPVTPAPPVMADQVPMTPTSVSPPTAAIADPPPNLQTSTRAQGNSVLPVVIGPALAALLVAGVVAGRLFRRR